MSMIDFKINYNAVFIPKTTKCLKRQPYSYGKLHKFLSFLNSQLHSQFLSQEHTCAIVWFSSNKLGPRD